MRNAAPLSVLLATFGALAASNCGFHHLADDCEFLRTCVAGAGGDGGGGASGAHGGGIGTAGHAGGDVTAGGSGQGGGSGASGAAGSAGEAPCGGDCGGSTPVCEASSNTCVECIDKSDCSTPKPACDTATNTCVECADKTDCKAPTPACDTAAHGCVECIASTDCTDSTKPVCDSKGQVCVACLADADCKDPAAARCDAGICKPCADKSQCAHVTGKAVCDITAGQCVQCTGSDYAACGKDPGTQTPLVCDSLAHICSANMKGTGGPCATCISDAQCKPGQICVLDTFGSKTVGYFCHWKRGDTANGAPDDCFATGRPYAAALPSVTSIDGQTSDICTLAVSTCVANNQYRSKDCKSGAVGDDSLCGVDPPNDAKCAQVPLSTSFACTMRCGIDKDCPDAFACDTNATPKVCKLN